MLYNRTNTNVILIWFRCYVALFMKLTCKALLFDLDGVLIDSNHVYEEHWSVWAQERGVSYRHILEVHHGRPVIETIQIVAPHLDPIVEAEAYRDGLLDRNHLNQVRLFPGVAELLGDLPMNRWAIATSAPRDSALRMLSHASLPMPNIFVTGDDIGRGKPAPYPYLRAAWGLNQKIEHCVVIEDAPAGIQSGRVAGAYVIAVATTNPPDTLKEADSIINSITDLYVENMGSHLRISYTALDRRH